MLHFTANGITQETGGQEKTWSIPELLETHDPLPGEPLAARNDAMRQVVEMAAEMFSELSETARLCYDFWKLLMPRRIEEQRFYFTTTGVHTYHWELTINELGLFYKDISEQFDSRLGWVSEQLFSDFWFYGPRLPTPDLNTRKILVAKIRNAFLQAGSPASYKHFEVFEYPKSPGSSLNWEIGDYKSSDFITVRDFGIEYSASNWRDGPTYSFLSFENFLTVPPREHSTITPEIRAKIEKHLARKTPEMRANNSPVPDGNAESKSLFMDNGGQTHYIYRDGDGDKYRASPAEEAAWRAELIENYKSRLSEEDHVAILEHIARGLKYNGVENVGDLLFEATKKANPKVQQSLAIVLVEKFDPERGAEALISLLEYEVETDYWRNFVFNSFFKMRDVRTVQNFIIECLRGGNETHFKKAVDVLTMWGINGDKPLQNRTLFQKLNWNDATASGPDFHQALEKTIKIILKQ